MIAACLALLLADVSIETEVGFRSRAFPDSWTRATAVLRTGEESFEGELRITVTGDAVEPAVYRHPLALPPNTHRRVAWDFHASGWEKRAEFEIFDSDGELVERRIEGIEFVRDRERRVLVVGPPPESLRGMERELNLGWAWVPAENVPDAYAPLLGLDVILFLGPEALQPGQAKALRKWMELGGRLVFLTGRRFAGAARGFWKEVSPVEVTGSRAEPLVLAEGKIRSGEVLLRHEGLTLAVRDRWGRGEIVFVAFSLDDERVGEVLSAAAFWRQVAGREEDEEVVRRRADASLQLIPTSQVHYRMEPPPAEFRVALLAGGLLLILLYVLVIGPVDYFRLRRRDRLRRGWVSFTLAVVLGSAVFVVMGGCFAAGGSSVRHLVFVDEGVMQSISVLHSGRSGEFEIHAEGSVSRFAAVMEGRILEPELASTCGPDGALRLPVPVMARRPFGATRTVTGGEFAVWCEWADRSGRVLQVENEGTVDLKDCVLVVGDRVYRLGDIGAGAGGGHELSAVPGLSFGEWMSEMLGTEVKPHYWGFRNFWSSVTSESLLHVVTFYEKERRMQHDAMWSRLRQRGLDLSGQVDRGAAVFVGRFEADVTGLRMEGVRPEVHGLFRAVLERP